MLDNSVAMTWCFGDELTPATRMLLQRTVERGAHAPSLWPIEAANVLIAAQRRARIEPSKRRELLGFLAELPVVIDPGTASHAWHAASDFADAFALSVYDACYLELAKRLGLPLGTLDHRLASAARCLDVRILPD
ncbi:type II toxin-antitoxin system VapC family toxin [Acidisphaera rubrifaciens]|uniref:PIN domain-containing protein n=1 Tax=Acidisphaera rubrifaciens HS-AP3 TaxID=1231350 RepID=A0A0D6P4H0_9PROT|nr:type II toxin-antitoxin system VapC family toxin [Acidisphaera rubrifaciens]GAN76572.1 hypothetical protein Asru_0120_04 [Acidisphaera rubrifaciens HS-AP3]